MKIRKYGLLRLTAILVLVLAASEFLVGRLESQRRAVDDARSDYIRALAQTRAQLANQLYEMSHDPVLISNLSGQLSYSVSRSLEGELHPGTFDFYIIFDEACHVIAKSTVFPIPVGLCQKSATDQWRWYSLDNKPAMFLLKNRTDVDKAFYVGAGRFIGSDWLLSFPGLLARLDKADLSLGVFMDESLCRWPHLCTEFNMSAWVEGRDANGLSLASLVSKNPSFSFLRPWLMSQHPLVNPLAIPLALLIALLLALEALRRRFISAKIQENQDAFLQWCQKPLESQLSTPFIPWLQKAQKSLSAIIKQNADRTADLVKSMDNLEHQHSCVQEKLTESERALSEHFPFSVLSNHIAQTGTSVQQILASVIEGSKDLASLLEKSLLSTNRKILDLLKIWQNGIAVRGERHYMRSLYEQEGRQEGESLLRSEINRLCSLTEQSNDAIMHSMSLIKRLQMQERETTSILDAWSILAQKISDPTLSLIKIGETAAALIQVERGQQVRFIGKFDANLSLNLPVPTLLSALLRLFSAMKEGLRDASPEETLVYQAHKRQKHDDFVLALSLTNERGKILLCNPKDEDLARAEEMLRPWDIECQVIRRSESGAYVILRGKAALLIASDESSASVETRRPGMPILQPNA